MWLQRRTGRGVGHRISSVPAGNKTQVVKTVTTLVTYQGPLVFFLGGGGSWTSKRKRNYELYERSYRSSNYLVFGSVILKFKGRK
jgi:hypothetical protein